MDNKTLTRVLFFCVFSMTAIHLSSCMTHKDIFSNHAKELGFPSGVGGDYRQIDLNKWRDAGRLSSDTTLSDYQDQDTSHIDDWTEKGFRNIKKSISIKRKWNQVARMFMTPLKECLIINSKGKVTASNKVATCNTYGKFCHKVSGSSLQLLNIKTRKYVAIDNKGLIYSTDDGASKDTVMTDVIANHNTFSIYIYKIINNKKCYLDVNSNSVLQSCSLTPTQLKPELKGNCI